jgi:hypothetical protein
MVMARLTVIVIVDIVPVIMAVVILVTATVVVVANIRKQLRIFRPRTATSATSC